MLPGELSENAECPQGAEIVLSDAERALLLVLWAQPYRDWFGVRLGGLPRDWLNQGAVTELAIARAQSDAGIASAFAEGVIRDAKR